MNHQKNKQRSFRTAFAILLISAILCISVFAIVPENGVGGGNSLGSTAEKAGNSIGSVLDKAGDAANDALDGIGDSIDGNRGETNRDTDSRPDHGDANTGIVGDRPEDAIIGDAEDGIIDEKPEGSNPGVIGSTAVDASDNTAGWVLLVVFLAAAAVVVALILSPKRSSEY